MMPTRTRHLCVLLPALLGLAAAGPTRKDPASDDLPALNRKVVEFTRGQAGEKVGNGQCTALASEALRRAGAKRFPFHGTGGDYVWGRPVDSFREALPGDIVQFRDAVFRGRTPLSGHRWMSWRQEYAHHTAVVSEVRDRGKVVVLLHQNVGPPGASAAEKQVVTETTLRTDSLQKGGRIWIYRPVPPEEADDDR